MIFNVRNATWRLWHLNVDGYRPPWCEMFNEASGIIKPCPGDDGALKCLSGRYFIWDFSFFCRWCRIFIARLSFAQQLSVVLWWRKYLEVSHDRREANAHWIISKYCLYDLRAPRWKASLRPAIATSRFHGVPSDLPMMKAKAKNGVQKATRYYFAWIVFLWRCRRSRYYEYISWWTKYTS